jgi:hypothetical protein
MEKLGDPQEGAGRNFSEDRCCANEYGGLEARRY